MAATTLISSLLCLFLVFISQRTTAHPLVHHNVINQVDGTPSTAVSNPCDPPDEAAAILKEENKHQFFPYSPGAYGIQSFNIDNERPPSTSEPGDRDCRVGDASGSAPNRVSSCSWSYILDFNPERIPQSLNVAVCDDCVWCKDSNANYMDYETSSCQPVEYPMNVLKRRECIDGMFKYEMTTERIAVACSCQRSQTGKRSANNVLQSEVEPQTFTLDLNL